MAVFIVFMIVVLLSYLIIWTPFVSLLSKDVIIYHLDSNIDLAHPHDVDDRSYPHYHEDTQDARVP
jgi:hypothetical protein